MPERLPFSILTFDVFQDKYIDEKYTHTYLTKAEAEFEADYLLAELLKESQTEPSSVEHNGGPTYSLSIVRPTGEITFFTRG